MKNVDDLESAINEAKGIGNIESSASEVQEKGNSEFARDEEVGFHKGALNVLVAERGELLKMISNVEAIAGAHIKRLKELGVEVK